MVRTQAQVAGTLFVLALTSGCGAVYANKYRDAIADNQVGLTKLSMGMSREQAATVMGDGDQVQYRKITFNDPWRSERFADQQGRNVIVVMYLTQHPASWRNVKDEDLTPLVFIEDRLAGYGWSYLRQVNR